VDLQSTMQWLYQLPLLMKVIGNAVVVLVALFISVGFWRPVRESPTTPSNSVPGAGGAAYSEGHGNIVSGGKGSAPGFGGAGGPGGNAYSEGDDNVVVGGDAGAAGRNPGDGGAGGNPGRIESSSDPALQRVQLIEALRAEYLAAHKDAPAAYRQSPPQLPQDWINQRLQQLGADWRVKNGPPGQGYLILSRTRPASR
jgi:hypothetical protein